MSSPNIPTETEVRTKLFTFAVAEVVAPRPDHLKYRLLTNEVLAEIIEKESRGNPNAIGDTHLRDFALGILQIRMCVIKDVNDTYDTNYVSEDRLDVDKSIQIYHLYLSKGIDLFLKKFKRYPTKIELKAMWNGGIYKGYRNPKALAYARR